MRQIDTGLWEIRKTLHIKGLELGTRMTIVKLPDGGLFLHSPVKLSDSTTGHLQQLGEVKHVVAPNLGHHLFIDSYFEAFPKAMFWGAPGLARKRSDLNFHEVLSNRAFGDWEEVMEQHVFAGMPNLNEVMFFHLPTKTLILTDVVFNLRQKQSLIASLFLRLNGIHNCFNASRIFRSMVKDKEAAQRSAQKMLSWKPSRVIMSHGEILDKNAAQALEEAFSFLA